MEQQVLFGLRTAPESSTKLRLSQGEKKSLSKKISFLLTDYSVQKHPCAIADLF